MKTKILICSIILLSFAFTGSVFGGYEGATNTLYGEGAGPNVDNDLPGYVTFIGAYAGSLNTNEGRYNTFIGSSAGSNNTTADDNTFVGSHSGYSNTSGYDNTFLGSHSGYSNNSGEYNTFLGYAAGWTNTTGHHNALLGSYTGYSNITGSYNTFIGVDAGWHNTSGAQNTFHGYAAGWANTTGYENTFVGYEAGFSNITGCQNTFLGHYAGYKNTGYYNTFLGFHTGYNNTIGESNTFVGYGAGYQNQSGDYNIFLGYQAGYENTNGSGNVFLGYMAGYNETGTDKLYIDSYPTSTPLIYGEFNNDIVTIYGKLGIGTKTPTQKIDLGGGVLTLNGSDNTGAMPPSLSSQSYDPGRIDFGYGGSGGGNLEAYSKAPTNYSLPEDDRRGEFRFVYGGGPTMGKVRYVHYDGTTWSTRMWLTYDGQLQMTPDGYNVSAYTDGYQWVDASSRAYKENIRGLSVDEAMETLKELSPVKFNYRADSKETHVGFVAEDVPALVVTSDRKGMSPMDVVAVLTKVVQELKAENEGLKAKNESLENRLLAIERMIIVPK